jgi:hypothetical protein
MFLFTPSVTTDINLLFLRETAQLLLSCILSHHLRLPVNRSSLAVTHTNNLWTSYIGYLAGPLNYRLPDVRIHEHAFIGYGLYLEI